MPQYEVSIRVRDMKNKKSVIDLSITDTDIAAAAGTVRTLVESMDVVIRGSIERVFIGQKEDISGWTLKAAPTSGADVQEAAEIVIRNSDDTINYVTIPTIDETAWGYEGSVSEYILSSAPAAVQTLWGNLSAFCDYRGADWLSGNAFQYAREVFRNRKRR
jgi:hypothetical protein